MFKNKFMDKMLGGREIEHKTLYVVYNVIRAPKYGQYALHPLKFKGYSDIWQYGMAKCIVTQKKQKASLDGYTKIQKAGRF